MVASKGVHVVHVVHVVPTLRNRVVIFLLETLKCCSMLNKFLFIALWRANAQLNLTRSLFFVP